MYNPRKNIFGDDTVAVKFAKSVRVVTIPPILVLALLTILIGNFDEFYTGVLDYALAVVFLMLIPTLAYPAQMLHPVWRTQGRACQRKLAFIFSVIGYSVGLSLAIINRAQPKLLTIYIGYFCSVLLLTVFNKGLKIHASGHAAGVTGPLLYFAVFSNAWLVPVAALLYVAIIWSSVKMKRHTVTEFILGTLCSVLAFIISMLFLAFIL